jgi:hypothetical protein
VLRGELIKVEVRAWSGFAAARAATAGLLAQVVVASTGSRAGSVRDNVATRRPSRVHPPIRTARTGAHFISVCAALPASSASALAFVSVVRRAPAPPLELVLLILRKAPEARDRATNLASETSTSGFASAVSSTRREAVVSALP